MKHLKEQINESILGTGLGLVAIYLIGSIVGYKYIDDKAHDDDFDIKDAIAWLAREYKKDWDKYKEDLEKFKNDPEVQAAIVQGKAGFEEFKQKVSQKLSTEAKKFLEKVSKHFKK